ncbi:MAG: FAD:protein FMN transferase, partial [Planctomycetia bacterium]|nr:FAD:protein FMN transferase [Planctomycetia bacterium]
MGFGVAAIARCRPHTPPVTSVSQPTTVAPVQAAQPPVRTAATRRLMGVPWTVTVHADSSGRAARAIAAAFAEVARLESILSDYDAGSELSRLSAAAPTAVPIAVGDDLWRVLARAAEIRDATGGAFDPTVGPLTTLWRRARRTGRMPPAARL